MKTNIQLKENQPPYTMGAYEGFEESENELPAVMTEEEQHDPYNFYPDAAF